MCFSLLYKYEIFEIVIIIKRAIKKLQSAMSSSSSAKPPVLSMQVLSAKEHPVSQDLLSPNALKVLHRLNQAGYEAYLVGGCVRDIFLGQRPKDFDVATSATPEQIKRLFRNCRIIGRRFKLAHIMFGREIIEVATFRGPHQNTDDNKNLAKQDGHGQLVRDNVYGTLEQDAERRDFTFNAMYYCAADNTVRDFANGVTAIKQKRLQIIGDPETRYREDPVRMLRAVRFAAKLNMQIDEASTTQIKQLGYLLENIPPARLFEEVLKLFLSGQGLATYHKMVEFGLFERLFPQTGPLVKVADSRETRFIERVLINTDNRINNGQRVTPAFLYAALLWYPIEEFCEKLKTESNLSPLDAFNIACSEVLHRQLQRVMIPKRFSITMREIWTFQSRLSRRYGRRAYQMLAHPKFRAAYDFLLLRGEIEGGELFELAEWWTEFQDADSDTRKLMLDKLHKQPGTAKNPRRRRRPKKKTNTKSSSL